MTDSPFTHANALKIYGPPGSGKTRELVRILQEHVADGDFRLGDGIIVSFTKAAAQDIARRVNPDGEPGRYHCTLHALCKRYYSFDGEIADTKLKAFFEPLGIEWRRTRSGDPEEWASAEGDQQTAGGQLISFWTYCRNRMISTREGRALARSQMGEEIQNWSPQKLDQMWAKYCAWKEETGMFDFTDMLEYAVANPPAEQFAFFVMDESQDATPLQWAVAQVFAAHADVVYLGGDEDQCQPPGTMVLTPSGYRPIEEIGEGDGVITYVRASAQIYGWKKPFRVRVSSRLFEGDLIVVRAGDRSTRCTPNHRWLTRWTAEARDEKYAVYLMRQGERWRVGWCKLIRSDGNFHLGQRARLEHADAAWILRICDDRGEASIWESIIATRFGLPLFLFEPQPGHYTRERLELAFSELAGELPKRASECLAAHGLDARYPIYSPERAYAKRGGAQIMELEACNLIPGLMSVPVYEDRKHARWEPLRIERQPYSGPVYSLDVERHHTYIADGLVTHNCIYNWLAASPSHFLQADTGKPDILHANHRSGAVLVDAAQKFIRRNTERQDKAMVATREGGVIDRSLWLPPLDISGSTFVMARAHYLNESAMQQLTEAEFPFIDKRGKYGVNGSQALAYQRFLRLHRKQGITLDEWRNLAQAVPSAGPWLIRGSKTRLLKLDPTFRRETVVRLNDLGAYGATEELVAAIEKGETAPLGYLDQQRLGYLRAVEKRYGADYLDEAKAGQVCQVGPIHSFKGLEADHVVLHSGMSPAATREAWIDPEPERRVFYVALTRARERLTMLEGKAFAKYQEVL